MRSTLKNNSIALLTKSPEKEIEWKSNISKSVSQLIWIGNGQKSMRILEKDKESYLRNGWNLGRVYFYRKSEQLQKCIHCGIETNASNIKRWHGDKCKQNPYISSMESIKN